MRIRTSITLLACFCLATLLGCLPTYVGDPDKSTMDPKYVGIWHLTADREEQLWFVHKLDAKTYLVQAYNFKRGEDNTPRLDTPTLTMRAWLTPINGATFVSMEAFRPQMLTSPKAIENADRYIVAKVDLKDDTLTIHLVVPEVVKEKDVTTPQQFEQLIKDNGDNRELFMQPNTFTRIDPKQTAPLQDLLDLIK